MARDPTHDAIRADVAVVGAGAAGLYTALVAAGALGLRGGGRVVLVSRSPLAQSASYRAQGGVAAALDPADSPDRHLEDTLAAGRAASRESAARVLCEESPARVRELQDLGVRFDADRLGALALGLEGGHSARRIVHAGGSATGRRITRQLSARAAVDEGLEVLEGHTVSALWISADRCVGMVTQPPGGLPGEGPLLLAPATVLATGGAAALWERTTNPQGAIGAGMTLAHHAGAALADLELVQFHPTALVSGGSHDGFLVTEAVRGEGARLLDAGGERFVDELAPRDEVALAILERMRATGRRSVDLDMRGVDVRRFPTVASTLRAAGVDPSHDLVPVAPATHYTMGGVATDLDGRSSLPGLYAVGECACTGLHGANRLASNSLAECFVFGRRAAIAASGEAELPTELEPPPQPTPSPVPSPETRAGLWRLAGLKRSAAGLSEAAGSDLALARMIARSGLAREESRGAHQRRDRPETDPALDGMHAVVGAEETPEFDRWR